MMSRIFDTRQIKALTFDMIGTVVDWRSSLANEAKQFGLDGEAFAAAWVSAYAQGVAAIRDGGAPWATVDEINLHSLKKLLPEFGVELPQDSLYRLNAAWHRLRPWQDVPDNLARLATKYCVVPLSNTNASMLEDMAKAGNLAWSRILAVDLGIRRYKPDLEVYRWAARELQLPATEIMMVAAHAYDLRAARDVGFRTTYIFRTSEEDQPLPGDNFDIVVHTYEELRQILSA